ncbi:MAG: aminodeoxychorismate lyase [Methylococcales bacterium]|nr:aminodeoxychorismate lyase [Methylococcales bacterium]
MMIWWNFWQTKPNFGFIFHNIIMMLVNGVAQTHIDVTDRGFQYGDGLFETITVHNGKAVFLTQHIARLTAACQRLHIPCPNLDLLHTEIRQLCQHVEQAVLKIIITRGSGGRGYRQPDDVQPTRVLSLHPLPTYPDSYATQGITARFCDTRLGLNPTLAGMKHLNRLEQVLARAEWHDDSIQEGIMLDINDCVIEGTMSNLFYCKNNQLYTATLTQSGIAGIIRALIISHETVIEHTYNKADLLAADELFVCNSVIGIWGLKQLANHAFAVGNKTKHLQHWLTQQATHNA